MELLRELTRAKGSGALVVSHDPRLEVLADRVLRLEDGRIAAAIPAGAAR